MRRSNGFLLVAALVAAVIHASCDSDPVRVNQPPVIEYFTPQNRHLTRYVGDTIHFTVRGVDPSSDPLTTSFLVNGKWTADGAEFDYAVVDTGLVMVTGRVSDGQRDCSVSWTVRREARLNQPPRIDSAIPFQSNPTMSLGGSMEFSVLASDADGDTLQYAFTVDDTTVSRQSHFTYHASSVGTKSIRAQVSDGMASVTRQWQLTVSTAPNLPPVILRASPATSTPSVVVGSSIEFSVEAIDPEGAALYYTYRVDNVTESNQSEFTYVASSIGTRWVRALVSDGTNEVTWSWQLSVKPNLPPVIESTLPVETEVAVLLFSPVDFAVTASDPEDAPLQYSYLVDGVPVSSQSQFTFVGYSIGTRTVRVVVSDGVQDVAHDWQVTVQAETNFGGRVIDTVTRQGIPNAIVTYRGMTTTTDQDGVYEFSALTGGSGTIEVRDEDGPGIGAYYDYAMTYSVKPLDVLNLYLIPDYPLTTTYYSDFLEFFRSMTDKGIIPYPADQRRHALPIALYARPFEKNGLDYAATIRSVAAEFDQILGEPVFYRVDDATTPARIETAYNGIISRDRYTILTWSEDWYPLAGLIEFRVHYSADVVEAFKEIIRHEMGHSLGLNHSLDPAHLMQGATASNTPTFTSDEIAVLRTYYAIPRGWNVRAFQRE